jgi:hypothetical protein
MRCALTAIGTAAIGIRFSLSVEMLLQPRLAAFASTA